MKNQKHRRPTLILLTLLLALTACSGASTKDDSAAQLSALPEWDLVVISDSSGWGLADALAQSIESELGITVNVTDLAVANLSAGRVLNALQGGEGEYHAVMSRLPEIISQAEFIVFMASPAESISEANPGDWNCFPPPPYYANDCSAESFAVYEQHLDQIYTEILRLRGEQPTIIRAFGYWMRPDLHALDGATESCRVCLDALNDILATAAGKYGIPFANSADIFNGELHDQDPVSQGFIGEDGQHASESGQQALASLILQLGYEPIEMQSDR